MYVLYGGENYCGYCVLLGEERFVWELELLSSPVCTRVACVVRAIVPTFPMASTWTAALNPGH